LAATKATPPSGQISGICVVCNRETRNGISLKDCVSNNFTGWNRFFSGNCMCPECAFLFSDQTFRKKSWVACIHNFSTFKNSEAQTILLKPPEPPFFIHIAKRGQRQTWLTCLHRVAFNRNRFFFSHEDYDVPILFERDKAQHYFDKAATALELGITKNELIAGEFKPKTWQKAYQRGYLDFLRELREHRGEVLWEVIVDVSRKRETNN